jgi:hypothetical protein
MSDDIQTIFNSLADERGGAERLTVAEQAIIRGVARLLADDVLDSKTATAAAQLSTLLPPAIKPKASEPLEIRFVGADDDLRDLDLDRLDPEELCTFEAILAKAMGGQPRRLQAALKLSRALDRAERDLSKPLKECSGADLDHRLRTVIMNSLGDLMGSTHIVHSLYGVSDAAQMRTELEVLRADLQRAQDELNALKGTSASNVLSLAERRAQAELQAPIMRNGSDIGTLNLMLTGRPGTPFDMPPGW